MFAIIHFVNCLKYLCTCQILIYICELVFETKQRWKTSTNQENRVQQESSLDSIALIVKISILAFVYSYEPTLDYVNLSHPMSYKLQLKILKLLLDYLLYFMFTPQTKHICNAHNKQYKYSMNMY